MSETTDPIQLEIYRNLFFSVAEEMGTVLRRTAYSPNIKERRDYSCALFDSEGNLAAMGDHMPVHLGSMPMSVRAAIEAMPLYCGDIVILNDPFSGGTHLPDITLVAPVFEPDENAIRPLFYVAARAHHSDVGGMTPGSMPLSQEIFQEGLVIPPLKLYLEGVLNQALLKLLLHNVRTPHEREGDLASQVGALRVGERRLLELIRRHGRFEMESYSKALQDYSERMVRRLISRIPDGEYEAEEFLDDGGEIESGLARPVRIKVRLSVKGDEISFDFAGTDAQVKGCLNAVRAITLSAVFYVVRCLIDEDVPSTAGLMRPIEVSAPSGTVVDAVFPAATAAGNVETSQRIVDVVLKALAEALPHRIPAASSGTMNNLALGGLRPTDRQPFTYYETVGGGMGASSAGDGDNGVHTHMTNSLNTPIEAFENQYPIRVREYRLRQGSGGRGQHRGGDGIVRSLEMLTDTWVTLLSERRRFSPYGLGGGRAGKKGMNFLGPSRGRRKKLGGKAQLELSRGDILIVETPGGGGWGAPDRGPASSQPAGPRRSSSRGRRPPKRAPKPEGSQKPNLKGPPPDSKHRGRSNPKSKNRHRDHRSKPSAQARSRSESKQQKESPNKTTAAKGGEQRRPLPQPPPGPGGKGPDKLPPEELPPPLPGGGREKKGGHPPAKDAQGLHREGPRKTDPDKP